jgi:hypothetical protein
MANKLTTVAHAALRRPVSELLSEERGLRAFSVCAFVGILAYLLIYHLHHQTSGEGHLGDFPTFYRAAELARDHGDIYSANQHGKQPYIYPPLTAVLYVPLTHLPVALAARVMLLMTTAMLIASLILAARELLRRFGNDASFPMVMAVCFWVAALNEDQLRAVMTMLETDALMLLLFTLALHWLDTKPLRAGMALAFAFNVKYLSIVMLPYLLLRRRWTVAATMILSSIAFGLLPALQLGWHENLRCLGVSTAGLLKWVGIAPAGLHAVTVFNVTGALSFSLTSGISRILKDHHAPAAALAPVIAAILLCVVTVATFLYRRNGFSLWRSVSASAQAFWPHSALTGIEWTMMVAAALSFSPQTNARHLVLGVLVNTPIGALLLISGNNRTRGLLLAALAIILFSGFGLTRHWTARVDHYGLPGAGILVGSLIFLAVALREVRTRQPLAGK